MEGPPTGAIGSACASNADCTGSSCLTDPSFPGGYCLKDCSKNPGCPAGSTCHTYDTNKLCMDSCAADGDCRAGYVCDYGVCRPKCTKNAVCQGPDTCLDGRCKPPCTKDAECPSGQRCQDGDCLPPCKQDTECLPGYRCDAKKGACVARPGIKMGLACKTSKECATAYCLPTRKICSIKCASAAACPSGYACGLEKFDSKGTGKFDAVEADCVPIKGKNKAGATCGKDADCAAGHCYYGFCMEGCTDDKGCGANQCVTVNILLPGAIPTYKGCLPHAGASSFTLGAFTNPGYLGFDVPPNASSFVLTSQVAAVGEVGAILVLKDPKATILTQSSDYASQCNFYRQTNRYYPSEQFASLFVPNTPGYTLVPGIHTYATSASKANLPVTVKLHLKLGKAQKGTLNLNWFFLNMAGTCIPGTTLNAASAATHTWLGQKRNNLLAILKTAGLKIGTETYHDIKDPALDVITLSSTGYSTELQKLFYSAKGMSGSAVNIFFVRKIQSSTTGGVVLGISGGIPGPPGVHDTVHSGVAMSMETACFEKYGYNPAHTLAHELGHYLGLFHNQESPTNPGLKNNTVVCNCPCGPNMTCEQQMGHNWCRGGDHIPDTTASTKNLMYYAAESTQMFDGNQLTAGQIRVILNNPVVGHK